uniref:Endonuclease/exonuclease/phosphatase domain-containing protein n=1 Tax=Trichogramma kaykai TaxID=54128 RepID=A0ABD2WBM5_9HYME
MFFNNYVIHRSDRPNNKGGGGTAILVKKKIAHSKVCHLNLDKLKDIEATIIKIPTSKGSLFITSIYAPGSSDVSINNELTYLCEKLKLDNPMNDYMFIGDMNAKHSAWNNLINNHRGVQLNNWLNNEGGNFNAKMVHSTTPTLYKHNSYIDLLICNNNLSLHSSNLETLDFESDHRAIAITALISHNTNNATIKTKTTYLYKKTNWSAFSANLNKFHKESPPEFINLTTDQIDKHIQDLQQTINSAIETSTPQFKEKCHLDNLVTSTIKTLYNRKHKLQSQLHKVRHKSDNFSKVLKNIIELRIKETKIKLAAEFTKESKRIWADKIKSIDHRNSASFFPTLNKMFRKRNSQNIDKLLVNFNQRDILVKCNIDADELDKTDNDFIINSPESIDKIIGEFFYAINTSDPPTVAPLEKIILNKSQEIRKISSDLTPATSFDRSNPASRPACLIESSGLYFTNVTEVKRLLKHMSSKTSTGWDEQLLSEKLPDSEATLSQDEMMTDDHADQAKTLKNPLNNDKVRPDLAISITSRGNDYRTLSQPPLHGAKLEDELDIGLSLTQAGSRPARGIDGEFFVSAPLPLDPSYQINSRGPKQPTKRKSSPSNYLSESKKHR